MQQHIVYQAYGNKNILYELVYSIISIKNIYNNTDYTFHIYTDDEVWLQPYLKEVNVVFHHLNKEQIRIWKGENDFVHRVKIKMLQHCCGHITEGKILYLDTDIICEKKIDDCWQQIDTDSFLMHEDEGPISSTTQVLFKKVYPHIVRQVQNNTMQTAQFDIWNAGLIGFDIAAKPLLEKVLALTDVLYEAYPKHIMEQLSFSYYLQQYGTIHAAKEYFFHYWLLKEFRDLLTSVFKLPVDNCLHVIRQLQQQKVPQILYEEKLANLKKRKTGFFAKTFTKKWQCPGWDEVVKRFDIQL